MKFRHTNVGGGIMTFHCHEGKPHTSNSGGSVILDHRCEQAYLEIEQIEEGPRRVKSVKKISEEK